MGGQKKTEGYADRLTVALERGPRPMSVRALARKIEEEYSELRGASYGGVRLYATGGARNPRVELLRAIADVLQVRGDWLAFDDGEMTEMLQARREEATAASGGAELSAAELRTLVLHRDILSGLGLRTPGDDDPESHPYWVAPASEIWFQLVAGAGTAAIMDPGVMIGRALRGPMEALGIDARKMHERNPTEFGHYVLAMTPALLMLCQERLRVDRAESENSTEKEE